jgi:hypothetical protein
LVVTFGVLVYTKICRLINGGMRLQRQNLYFIAIIPPGKICDDVEVFKKDFAGRFGAKEALKNVAHIRD